MRTGIVFALVLVLGVAAAPFSSAQEIYRFDGDAADPGSGADGAFDALDGTWSHDNGSDAWDGTVIGAGRPGGVSALADGGTDYISIQDTGDPRDHGMGDPGSNRKVYLGHNLSADGASDTVLDDGVRLTFRARLSSAGDDLHPDGGGAIGPLPAEGDGYLIHDGGKGNVGIKQAAGGVISFSLATDADNGGGGAGLLINNLNGSDITGDVDSGEDGTATQVSLDVTQWHEYEAFIQAGGSGTHTVQLKIDGALVGVFEVTAGNGNDFDDITYVGTGCGSTGQSGAVDIDFISVAVVGAVEVPALAAWALALLAVGLLGIGALALRRRTVPAAA